MRITTRLTGNWVGVKRALTTLAPTLTASAIWGQRRYGEHLVKTVKDHIIRQDLPYLGKKDDGRDLIDTYAYLSNIKTWQSGMKREVGIKPGVKNGKGVEIAKYAIIHEYGYGNHTKKPVWRDSIKELGGKNGPMNFVEAAIAQKLIKLRAQGFEVKLKSGMSSKIMSKIRR